MNKEVRSIKIRSSMNTNLSYTSPDRKYFTQSFKDFLYETDEAFRSKVMIPINEDVGLFNWAIDFIENPGQGFLVDIYCDNDSAFVRIHRIIVERFPDVEFLFWKKGPVIIKPFAA